MVFKHKYEVLVRDSLKDDYVTNKALLSYLESISSLHFNEVSKNNNYMKDNQLTWYLLDWKLEVINRPKVGDILEVETWTRSLNKFYSYRDFIVYKDGEVVAKAMSRWVLIDINDGEVKKINEDIVNMFEPENDKLAIDIDFDKIKSQALYEEEMIGTIRRSDIDFNNHVHNINYLDLVKDIMNDEDDKEYSNFRITYKKQIVLSDKIVIGKHKSSDKIYLIIKSEDSVNALIEMY